jgi:hypothetical protein
MAELPKIYVFCNNCSPGWHSMVAVAEDGTHLAGHICSNHGYANHDMGISATGWKRDKYAAHYPDGFEVVGVEDPKPGQHAGLDEALRRNLERMDADAAQPEAKP